MSAAIVLLFLLTSVFTFVSSDRKQSANGWEQDPTSTLAGNGTENKFIAATGLKGSSLHMITNVSHNTTTTTCFARNHSKPNDGNGSEENCNGSDDSSDSVESYIAFIIGVGINRYVLPVIIIVGSFGNFVSMCVMFQRQNRHTSFSIYLGCLAISDNCVLYGAAYYWMVSEIQVRPFNDVECKICNWILDVFQQNGVLLILSVTLDRLVAVRFPFKAAAWCRAKRAKIVSACVFTVVSIYNIPHFVLNKSDRRLLCKLCNSDNIICIIHFWVKVFIAFVLPFVLLLSMNTVIIQAVRNAIKYRPGHASDYETETTTTESIEVSELSAQDTTPSAAPERLRRDNKKKVLSKDRNLIAMLFLVNFMFLFLNAPRFIRTILFFTVHVEPTPHSIAFGFLVFHITNKLYLFNNACNFFLYCVSGSKFRRDFVKLFREHFWQRCCKTTTAEASNPSSTQHH